MIVKIINPGKPLKRKRRKKSRPGNKKTNSKTKWRPNSMAFKKRKTRKRSYKKRNPGRHAPKVSYVVSNKKRRKHTRRRRNPEAGLSSSRMTVGNIAMAGAGAVAGAVAYEVTNSLMQTSGNGKYLVALGLAGAGWFLLDKFLPKAAVPFASGVIAIAALEYLRESGVISGLSGQSYDNLYAPDYPDTLGLVPRNDLLGDGMGLVPRGDDIPLTDPAMYAGVSGNYQEN